MRPITPLLAALTFLAALAGCGTKTPLTLPPPPAKAAAMPMPPQQETAQKRGPATDRRDARGEARQ